MDKNSFFWKIVDGRLPAPPCAKTLGIEFAAIDGERGTAEVKFEAKPEFLNPAGNVQGGFLAAMLDDTMGPALTATLDAGEFAPTVNLNVQFHRPAKVGSLKRHRPRDAARQGSLPIEQRIVSERPDCGERDCHSYNSENVGK